MSASARSSRIGSMLDVGWGDLIDYLGDDPHTHSIVIYMESIGDARAFLSAAREVALTKPIIVIKAGRTEAAAKAAASHTGSLTGSDEVLDAAFRRAACCASTPSPNCSTWPRCSAKQPRPRGPRLTIVTNAGGPGVLATDALIADGGELAPLSTRDDRRRSNELLPAALEPRQSGRYPRRRRRRSATRKALEIVAQRSGQRRPARHPHAAGDDRPHRDAPKLLKPFAKLDGKPMLASWMGGAGRRGRRGDPQPRRHSDVRLSRHAPRARFITCGGTRTTCARFTKRPRWPTSARTAPRATPRPPTHHRRVAQAGRDAADRGRVEATARRLRHSRPSETRDRHAPKTKPWQRPRRSASRSCSSFIRDTITHKTDVGGVKLNLQRRDGRPHGVSRDPRRTCDAQGRRRSISSASPCSRWSRCDGYELILGSSIDPQFGPVLLFGAGGQLVEVFKDRALGLPPLNAHAGAPDDGADAESSRPCRACAAASRWISRALEAAAGALQPAGRRAAMDQGDRHQPAARLARAAARAGRPRGAAPTGRSPRTNLPQPAIRPYPAQYVSADGRLRDGSADHRSARSGPRTSR